MFPLLLVHATIVMGVAHTIAHERICAPLRDMFGGKETWLGYLLSCPFCLSFWVALVLVPLTGVYYVEVAPMWVPVAWLLRWLLSGILIATVAAFLRVFFYFADGSQGLIRRTEKLVEKKGE